MKKANAFLKPEPGKKPAGSGMNASRGASMLKKGAGRFIPARQKLQDKAKTSLPSTAEDLKQQTLTAGYYSPVGQQMLQNLPVFYDPSLANNPNAVGQYHGAEQGIGLSPNYATYPEAGKQTLRHEFGHAASFQYPWAQNFRQDFRTFGNAPVTYNPAAQQPFYGFIGNQQPLKEWAKFPGMYGTEYNINNWGGPEELYASMASMPETIPGGYARFFPQMRGNVLTGPTSPDRPPAVAPVPGYHYHFYADNQNAFWGQAKNNWAGTVGETEQTVTYFVAPEAVQAGLPPPRGMEWSPVTETDDMGNPRPGFTAIPAQSSQQPMNQQATGISQRAQILLQWLYAGKITLQQYYELASQPQGAAP